jgi:hypothetical protein
MAIRKPHKRSQTIVVVSQQVPSYRPECNIRGCYWYGQIRDSMGNAQVLARQHHSAIHPEHHRSL